MYLCIFSYGTGRYAKGDVYSKHSTYDAARKRAKSSGYDSFLSIVHVPERPKRQVSLDSLSAWPLLGYFPPTVNPRKPWYSHLT